MLGRVSVLVVAVAAAVTLVAGAPLGALAPTAPAEHMRFAQVHARTRSEAPDWWHYVAPWWSPPDHAPTKEVPDFVDEPAYTHFKEPPKDTMAVYVPYGRDAMSSFVETDTQIMPRGVMPMARFQQEMAAIRSQSAAAAAPPMAAPQTYQQQYAAQQTAPPQQQIPMTYAPATESAAIATAPRFAGVYNTPGLPPQLPAFPGVPSVSDMRAASEFGLPSALQMPLYAPPQPQFAPMNGVDMMRMAQAQRGASPAGPAPTPLQQKAFEASEDARFAKLADDEFGAHAKLAASGASVPRIWRVDRQTKEDMEQEAEFESDANAIQDEADAQAAQESAEETVESETEEDADASGAMVFRQKLDAAEAKEREEHAAHIAEAQHLRDSAAAQWSDEEAAPAAAPAPGGFRFQQVHAEAEAEAETEAETGAEAEEGASLDMTAVMSHAHEVEAEVDAEDAAEEASAEVDAANDAAEAHTATEDANGMTEEVVSEEEVTEGDESESLAEEGLAGLDESADAEVEREADGLQRENERRARW